MMSSSTAGLSQASSQGQGPLHPMAGGGDINFTSAATADGQLAQQQHSHQTDSSSSAPQRDWRSMTRTIAHYERIEQIGEGTYGQVYRARCKDTDQIVAMKKIRVHHGGYWGMPPTVIREIKILKRLRHPNLVRMVEVVSSKGVEQLDEDDEVEEKHKVSKNDKVVDAREGFKGNLFLVLEYVSHDLTGLMDVAYKFSEVQVKSIFKQLLSALEYMHENKYVHRDIKSSNILIDHNFRVKLADFGLARSIEPPILDKIHNRESTQEFTNKVITLWYRPPEILLGATKYGPAVDIWSAGCILAELLIGRPLFAGKTELDQLNLIWDMIGTPTQATWDGFQDLLHIRSGQISIDKERKPRLREKYQRKIDGPAMNLLEKLLELDPKKRLTASRALASRYFLSEPKAPENPEELPPLDLGEGGHFHEFQTKKKRREAKREAEKAKEEARELGKPPKEAQAVFDAIYKEAMAKKVLEGTLTTKVPESTSEPKMDDREHSKKSAKRRDHKERKKDKDRKREHRDRDERDKKKKRKRDSRESRKSGGSSSEKERGRRLEKAPREEVSSRRDNDANFSPQDAVPSFNGADDVDQATKRSPGKELVHDKHRSSSSKERDSSDRRHREKKSRRTSRDDRKSRDRDYNESSRRNIELDGGENARADEWRRNQDREFSRSDRQHTRPGPPREDLGPYGPSQSSMYDGSSQRGPPHGDFDMYGPSNGNARGSPPPGRSRYGSERSPPRDYGAREESFDQYGPSSRHPPMRDGPRDYGRNQSPPRDHPRRSRSPGRYRTGPRDNPRDGPKDGPPGRDGYGPRGRPDGPPPRRGRGRGRGKGRR